MSALVGIIDSGVGPEQARAVAAARHFAALPGGEIRISAPGADRHGHGTVIADLILRQAPGARLIVAQVFDANRAATCGVVAAALSWLAGQGAGVINMSIGLCEDRDALRAACRAAAESGALLVGSVPAMGPLVFPAAYPGVIRVTGDGRCSGDEIAFIGNARVDFGASPRPRGCVGRAPAIAGASLAAARVSGRLAALLEREPHDPAAAVEALAAAAAHRGPQVPRHA